jgi:hypothetical protein
MPDRAPYPGLRSFKREETDLFFGRDDCTDAMVERLAETHFLAVLGSSGTGKSSLVRTGLLSGLDMGLMEGVGSNWRVVEFRPRGAPLRNLARQLLKVERSDGSDPDEEEIASLRARLKRGPRSLIERCRDGHLPDGASLLLLVDQFEELFRYENYAGREEAEAFVALLLESARTKDFSIYVTITMRSEYLGACSLIDGLADAINTGLYLTPRMTREECEEAIRGPAAVCGVELEDKLVNRVLNDLANLSPWDEKTDGDQLDRLARRADQLPLLQYTLNRMWVRTTEGGHDGSIRLTLAEYERIGGLGGALNGHANEILGKLSAANAVVAEKVFRALTGGSRVAVAARHPTQLQELIAMCDGVEAGVRTVVYAFRASECNFLHPECDTSLP